MEGLFGEDRIVAFGRQFESEHVRGLEVEDAIELPRGRRPFGSFDTLRGDVEGIDTPKTSGLRPPNRSPARATGEAESPKTRPTGQMLSRRVPGKILVRAPRDHLRPTAPDDLDCPPLIRGVDRMVPRLLDPLLLGATKTIDDRPPPGPLE